MLSTIHEAVLVDTGKKDKNDMPIEKPEAVYYYCQRMGGVDLSDQLLNYYAAAAGEGGGDGTPMKMYYEVFFGLVKNTLPPPPPPNGSADRL